MVIPARTMRASAALPAELKPSAVSCPLASGPAAFQLRDAMMTPDCAAVST